MMRQIHIKTILLPLSTLWGLEGNILRTTNMCIPEVFHKSVLTGQIQEVEQELQSFIDFCSVHAEDPAKVHHGFPN